MALTGSDSCTQVDGVREADVVANVTTDDIRSEVRKTSRGAFGKLKWRVSSRVEPEDFDVAHAGQRVEDCIVVDDQVPQRLRAVELSRCHKNAVDERARDGTSTRVD